MNTEFADNPRRHRFELRSGDEVLGFIVYRLADDSITLVHTEAEGDAVFPPFDRSAFREVRREPRPKGPDDEHAFTFVDLERRPAAALR